MEATAGLARDHRVIEMVLPALERMAEGFEAREFVRGGEVARALEFLREFVDGYHHRTEEALFSLLAERGVPRESGLVAELLAEHAEGRKRVWAMTAAFSEQVGEDVGAEHDLADQARSYVGLARRHIEGEESRLFPLAEDTLTSEDGERLLSEYAEIERETIGERGRERFREAAEALAGGG